jgi:hypothetical protein
MINKQIVHERIVQYLIILIVIVFVSQLLNGCQTGKQSEVPDYRLQLGNLESIIQSGNWLKLYTDRRAEPYTGTLNPGRITSSGRKYHILKFEYYDNNLPFSLQEGDTMILILDGRALIFIGYNISIQKNRLSAYYEIDKYDMVDIGNASGVEVMIKAQEGELRGTFSKENIYNYRYFAAKYILGAKDIPPLKEPDYEQPTAFLSGGAGTGIEFWFGYYTNFLNIKPGLADYLSAGMGIAGIDYSRYNHYQDQGYLWDGNYSLNNYYINVMYGLTHPSPFVNWSVELGFTYQYYFYDESWNSKNTGTEQFPTYYRLTNGDPYEGSVIGVFIQTGGLWVQFNRRKNWAAGIAIPIPWW